MPTEFLDAATAGYASWLRTDPTGYVLNCDRNPKPTYLMLHRAACHTISGSPSRGSTWTTAYAKVCADSFAELDAWAMRRTGAMPARCETCAP